MRCAPHAALRRLRAVCARGRLYDPTRAYVVGVLNVTPDSFSDGGTYMDTDAAVQRGVEMMAQGAHVIDVGGESTRPTGATYGSGAVEVDAAEELRRVLPVVRALVRDHGAVVSVDTSKAEVADACLGAGAEWINDVSGLRADPAMAPLLARHDCGVVLMHMRGTPQNTGRLAQFDDVVADVAQELGAVLTGALEAGVAAERIVLDPGLGFGKTAKQNLELLAGLPELLSLGRSLYVGPSRKRFVGEALGGLPVGQRIWGTAAAVSSAVLSGASFVRVHDVAEMAQVARVAEAIRAAGAAETPAGAQVEERHGLR